MEALIQVGIVLFMLLLGWSCGTIAQNRHLRSLDKRERKLSGMILSDIKRFPYGVQPGTKTTIVVGEVVIATDYMKTFLAAIRKLFGGEVHSYLCLLDRARREAMLRMMEQAHSEGYDAVCNIRLETASLGGMRKKTAAMVGIIASGTAYRRPRSAGA